MNSNRIFSKIFSVMSSVSCIIALYGCAGKTNYALPTTQTHLESNSKIIDRPRDSIWKTSIPELGKKFFVINNLDKSSGLINISYSGTPEHYLDCGRITSHVMSVMGERIYDFPGAKSQQYYEVMKIGEGLYSIDRTMELEGRINLIFEEMDQKSTKVTVNTRYIVKANYIIRNTRYQNIPQSVSDVASFNYGEQIPLRVGAEWHPVECIANGKLESEILSAIK